MSVTFNSLPASHNYVRSNIRDKSSLQLNSSITVSWYVGGGFNVNHTWLSWHKVPTGLVDDLYSKNAINVTNRLELDIMKNNISPPSYIHSDESTPDSSTIYGDMQYASGYFGGSARWGWINPTNPKSSENESYFTVDITSPPHQLLHNSGDGDHHFWLVAWSDVDAAWGDSNQGAPADRHPESHLSNIRTNSKWSVHNHKDTSTVQGRKYWASDPIEISIHKSNGKFVSMEVKSAVMQCAYWNRTSGPAHLYSPSPVYDWNMELIYKNTESKDIEAATSQFYLVFGIACIILLMVISRRYRAYRV